jgi:hypothetical protein
MFNYNFLRYNNLYLDIATEICLNYASYIIGNASKAQVYLFKRYCLKKSLEAFYKDKPLEATSIT